MEKTLQQIKDEWARHYGYIDYKEFYELTRVVDTDQVFIMDGAVNQVAIRYANEQKLELVDMLETVLNDYHNIIPKSDARDNRMDQIKQLIKSETEGYPFF